MKNNVNEPKVMFQIKCIELVDFKLNQLNQPLPEQTTFHFNINLEQKISPENKLVRWLQQSKYCMKIRQPGWHR